MKTLILHGVPYNVNDTNQVFLYTKHAVTSSKSSSSSSNAASSLCADPAQVGTYDSSSGSLHLFSDWETKAAAFLTTYRETLRANTEEALEKARALQGIA